jgi:hypothetical protein
MSFSSWNIGDSQFGVWGPPLFSIYVLKIVIVAPINLENGAFCLDPDPFKAHFRFDMRNVGLIDLDFVQTLALMRSQDIA